MLFSRPTRAVDVGLEERVQAVDVARSDAGEAVEAHPHPEQPVEDVGPLQAQLPRVRQERVERLVGLRRVEEEARSDLDLI